MKRARRELKPINQRNATPVFAEGLAKVRGGHGNIDPTTGAFENFITFGGYDTTDG